MMLMEEYKISEEIYQASLVTSSESLVSQMIYLRRLIL